MGWTISRSDRCPEIDLWNLYRGHHVCVLIHYCITYTCRSSHVASTLSKAASACQFTVAQVNASDESHSFRTRVKHSFAPFIKPPYQYKNFEFNGGENEPTILFGSRLGRDPEEPPIRSFYRLLHACSKTITEEVPKIPNEEDQDRIRQVLQTLINYHPL